MEAETAAICPYLQQREQRPDDGEMSRWHDVVTVDDSTKSTLLARPSCVRRDARARPKCTLPFRPTPVMHYATPYRTRRVAARPLGGTGDCRSTL